MLIYGKNKTLLSGNLYSANMKIKIQFSINCDSHKLRIEHGNNGYIYIFLAVRGMTFQIFSQLDIKK